MEEKECLDQNAPIVMEQTCICVEQVQWKNMDVGIVTRKQN